MKERSGRGARRVQCWGQLGKAPEEVVFGLSPDG